MKVVDTSFDLCKYFSTSKVNPSIQWFAEILQKSLPQDLLKPCPFSGEIKGYNLTLSGFTKVLNFFPGTYKTIMRFHDTKDFNVMTANLVTEMKMTNNVVKDMTNPIAIDG
jgi:hypothetical protein